MKFLSQLIAIDFPFLLLQIADTLVTVFLSIAILSVICIVVSVAVAKNRSANRLVATVCSLSGALPVLGVALVAQFIVPAESLSYILPLLLGGIPLLLFSLSGASAAHRSVPLLVATQKHTIVRKLAIVYLPYTFLGVAQGISVAIPAILLGTLLGQMIDGPAGSLGARLAALSISGPGAQRFTVSLALFGLSLLLWGTARAVEVTVRRWLDDSQVDGRSYEHEATSGRNVFAVTGLALAILFTIWFALAAIAPIVKSPTALLTHLLSNRYDSSALASNFAATALRFLISLILAIFVSYSLAALPQKYLWSRRIANSVGVFVQTIPAIFFLPALAAVSANSNVNAVVVATAAGTYGLLSALSARRLSWSDSLSLQVMTRNAKLLRLERFVLLPWSFAALLTGIRIAAPQTLSAILVCEYFAIGNGIGDQMKVTYTGQTFKEFWMLVASVICALAVISLLISYAESVFSKSWRTQ